MELSERIIIDTETELSCYPDRGMVFYHSHANMAALTPHEAEMLANYLEEHRDDDEMEFLLGDDPLEVAGQLREKAHLIEDES